jgi:hypothetical protein
MVPAVGTRGHRRKRRRRKSWHSITRRSTVLKRVKIRRRDLHPNLLAQKYPQPKMKLTSSS